MDTQTIPSADPKPARAASRPLPVESKEDVVIDCNINELYYGTFKAVRDTRIPIKKNAITAFIGPSGCGKSTVLRCLNRMNDLVRGFRFKGHVKYRGKDIYEPSIDPVAVRRYIGMVFQQPNPFATSIFNNVAFGLRINKFKGNKTEKVEQALKRAALWDEVKDKLSNSGLSLSGGQHKIEELMLELKKRYTIAIVTHNLQQAQRVADETGSLYVDTSAGGRTGYLVEYSDSKQLFENPREKHTRDYIRGEFS